MTNDKTTQWITKELSRLADRAVEIENKKDVKRFVDKMSFFEYLAKRFCLEEGIK